LKEMDKMFTVIECSLSFSLLHW